MDKEEERAYLNRWSFNAACLGKTPYLLSSTGATDHTIESGAAAAAPAPNPNSRNGDGGQQIE